MMKNLSPKASEFNQLFAERIKLQAAKQDIQKQKSLDKELKAMWFNMTTSEQKEIDDYYSMFGKWDPRSILKSNWE